MPWLRRGALGLDDLAFVGAPVAALQVAYHPVLDRSAMPAYLRGHGIPLTAHAPRAQGRAAGDATLARIGEQHGVPAAQVAIAWPLDRDGGVVAVPKAQHEASQIGHLAARDVRRDDDDRVAIAALPKDLPGGRPPFAPDRDAPAH